MASPNRGWNAWKVLSGALSLIVLLLGYLTTTSSPLSSEMFTRLLPRLHNTTAHFTARSFTSTSRTAFASTGTSFTPTAAPMASSLSFLDAIENRRSIYGLDKKTTVSDDKIKEIATHIIKETPSSFNSQSSRLVVLIKEEHDKFWDTTTAILKAHVPEDKWEHTGQRMDMFKAAYGTVLFYEDPEPIKALQSKFPQYADKFPQWSEHTSAMHQFALWTALEAEGLGANLQHYNPLPDQKASEIWNVPLEWSLKSQLVFGNPVDAKREKIQAKTYEAVEKRLAFHGF